MNAESSAYRLPSAARFWAAEKRAGSEAEEGRATRGVPVAARSRLVRAGGLAPRERQQSARIQLRRSSSAFHSSGAVRGYSLWYDERSISVKSAAVAASADSAGAGAAAGAADILVLWAGGGSQPNARALAALSCRVAQLAANGVCRTRHWQQGAPTRSARQPARGAGTGVSVWLGPVRWPQRALVVGSSRRGCQCRIPRLPQPRAHDAHAC